ncbi:MAG: hypothetical protein JNJ55_06050 [Betaproteobacteria bacterium]|nr:hypothetical protein [Betaproteobacteria bacterium]
MFVMLIAVAWLAWFMRERGASARLRTSASHATAPAHASASHPLRTQQTRRAPSRELTWYEAMQVEISKFLGIPDPFEYLDVEVCGIGKESVRAVDGGLPPLLAIAVEQEWLQWREKLLKHGSTEDIVSVRYVDAFRSYAKASEEFDRRSSGSSADMEESTRIGRASTTPHIAALLDVAKKTNDAEVAFAAMTVCGFVNDKLCVLEYAERLVALDPNSAHSWLTLAAAAREVGDEVRRQYAVRRASSGLQYLPKFNPVRRLLVGREFAALSDASRQRLSLVLQPFAFDVPLTNSEVYAHCNANMDWQDSERSQRCRKFTEMLATKDDLVSPSLAALLSIPAGWPASHRDALMRERETLMKELESMQFEKPFSCESLRQTELFARESARFGERTALRKRIEARGETMEQAVGRVVEQKRVLERK